MEILHLPLFREQPPSLDDTSNNSGSMQAFPDTSETLLGNCSHGNETRKREQLHATTSSSSSRNQHVATFYKESFTPVNAPAVLYSISQANTSDIIDLTIDKQDTIDLTDDVIDLTTETQANLEIANRTSDIIDLTLGTEASFIDITTDDTGKQLELMDTTEPRAVTAKDLFRVPDGTNGERDDDISARLQSSLDVSDGTSSMESKTASASTIDVSMVRLMYLG